MSLYGVYLSLLFWDKPGWEHGFDLIPNVFAKGIKLSTLFEEHGGRNDTLLVVPGFNPPGNGSWDTERD
jgi:hypothetical protein